MPSGPVYLEFTGHATRVMDERTIPVEWVEQAVAEPMMHTLDPNDPELDRFFHRIPERDDRVLRVVVNTNVVPLAGGQRIL